MFNVSVEDDWDNEEEQLTTTTTKTPPLLAASVVGGAAVGSSSSSSRTVISHPTPASMSGLISTVTRGYKHHRTQETGFRTTAFVAPFEKGVVDGLVDSRMGRGDLWGSHACHCIQCEAVTVLKKAGAVIEKNICNESQSTTSSSSAPPPPIVVVAVDLDNFGFNHFKQSFDKLVVNAAAGGKKRGRDNDTEGSVVSSTSGIDSNELLSRCVFWCFYGACFSRQHDVTPSEYMKATLSECVNNKKSSNLSVWEELMLRDRLSASDAIIVSSSSKSDTQPPQQDTLARSPHLHLTPCGGHSQAVDEVMLAAAWRLSGAADNNSPTTSSSSPSSSSSLKIPMVVVTGDKGLASAVESACKDNGHVRTVCSNGPGMGGGRMVLVWREILKCVAAL